MNIYTQQRGGRKALALSAALSPLYCCSSSGGTHKREAHGEKSWS